ncbi:hypothetical protein HMPREF0083_02500 [Aneurinibacillus aneurinilyticus ATCC 12856]|uniref:Uncharacterized protein n=1 Tax=Aneurinibacillus aneurinilyticus ATCC 12856 TaxID=649747 RepID=U1YBD5_ANEAE|nr:hypothetical protein HMPREF0083_02500 [Aneurinibacillus aneurinilyticus ATCC 12856]
MKKLYCSVVLIPSIFLCGTLIGPSQEKLSASQNKVQSNIILLNKTNVHIQKVKSLLKKSPLQPLPPGKGIKTVKIGEGLTPLPRTTDTKNGIPGLKQLN